MKHMIWSQHIWLVVFMALGVPEMAVSALDLELPGNQPQCFGISRGKHFILGFSDNHDSRSETRELTILVVAFSHLQTTVTISSKYEVAGRPFQKSFVIEAGGYRRIIVPAELVMDGNERSLKGIEISASSEVSAYGLMYQDYTTDGFLAIPTHNLGMQYVLLMGASLNSLPTQFSVIGIEDSTLVQVTLRGSLTFEERPYDVGDVLSFTVDRLEAVQIQGDAWQDLTGSIIQTNKPVVVFSGNQCANNPASSCDTQTEQLVPVKSWGLTHIYTASRSTDRNTYRVVAYFSETVVSIPGFANQSLDAGEFWEGSLLGAGLVSSSKPALMMQQLVYINGELLDPSLIQVPALEHFGYVFGFTTPPYSGGDSEGFLNFISIIVAHGARQTVYLNGSPINGIQVTESDVPNTDYTSLTVQLPKGEGVYYVEQTDPLSLPLSVIVYGYEEAESFGYAAGLSLPSNNQLLSLTPYYLRQLGGEVFTITVPCLEINVISYGRAKCKFSTGFGDVLVSGYRTDPYTVVCITPTFYKIGLSTVYLSLDDGSTYAYSGLVYVASQEDLPPQISVQQINAEDGGEIIDLTSDDSIIFSWDPTSIGEDTSHVTVMMQDTDYNDDENPVLMDGIVLKTDVVNSGHLEIHPRDLRSLVGDGISISAFYLTQVEVRNRRDINGVFNAVGSFLKRVYSGVKRVVKSILDLPCTVFNKQLVNVASGLGPCPCTSRQANFDSLNFVKANFFNFFFHSGADDCYRSTASSSTGSGQQCCYGADGNILVGPPGGGTADRYSPGDHFWEHQWYDVLPWFGCCKFSDNCDTYYRFRPSDDCSKYEPPRPAGGWGDPHVTSLDGHKFTFNGAGEFMMASSMLHNVTFQARMERYRNTNASVYTAIVLQTNDPSKVQVQMSNMNETLILVDGEPLRLESIPIRVHHLGGVRISFNADITQIKIAFSAGIAVIVNIDPEVMSFIAQLDTKFQGQVKGLLGNLNGDPNDDLQFPNGTIMKPDSSLRELHDFGMEWLVAKEASIFTYISPYDYSTYYFPEFAPTFENPDLVSQEIKDLCGDSIECVFDAVTTGSLSFANETLLVSGTIADIQKASVKIVSCGFPGEVENGAVSGSVYFVDATVEVTCDDGSILEGSSTLTCQADGQWSSALPRCTNIKDEGLSPGIIAAIVVGAIVVLVVPVLVVFFVKKKSRVSPL